MSLFSQKLKATISKTGVPVYALAKKAGVNRPMIHKSQQGDRIPGDDFIEKLSNAMMLTDSEKKELMALASRARMGESLYLKRQALLKVLNCLSVEFDEMDVISLSKPRKKEEYLQNEVFLKDYMHIKHALFNMLKKKMTLSKTEKIYVCLPEHAKELFSMIYHLWSAESAKNIELVNLIGLEKEYQCHEAVSRNLLLISCVLDYCFLPKKTIEIYYHYLNYPQNLDLPTMPYYIKTESSVLSLSADLKTGVFYESQAMLNFYNYAIQERIKASTKLIYYDKKKTERSKCEKAFCLFESVPCRAASKLGQNTKEKYLEEKNLGTETLVEKIIAFQKNFQEKDLNSISFFQIEKLRAFMKNGEFQSVPSKWDYKATKEERRAIILGILEGLKNNKTKNCYAINSEKLYITINADVIITREDGVKICWYSEEESDFKVVSIRETSFVEGFMDFFEYLPNSDLVLSNEEMIGQIEGLLGLEI